MATIVNVTFGAREPTVTAGFWRKALGYVASEERNDLVRLTCDEPGAPDLLFLRIDQPRAGCNRVHLDLACDDIAAEVARLVDLGATLADSANDQLVWRRANGIEWIVLQDPEGNEFCIGYPPPP